MIRVILSPDDSATSSRGEGNTLEAAVDALLKDLILTYGHQVLTSQLFEGLSKLMGGEKQWQHWDMSCPEECFSLDVEEYRSEQESHPEKVTPAILQQCLQAYCNFTGISLGECTEPELVAYWPKYISDSPGYVGPVVVFVWPAGPDTFTSFTYDKEAGIWQVEGVSRA